MCNDAGMLDLSIPRCVIVLLVIGTTVMYVPCFLSENGKYRNILYVDSQSMLFRNTVVASLTLCVPFLADFPHEGLSFSQFQALSKEYIFCILIWLSQICPSIIFIVLLGALQETQFLASTMLLHSMVFIGAVTFYIYQSCDGILYRRFYYLITIIVGVSGCCLYRLGSDYYSTTGYILATIGQIFLILFVAITFYLSFLWYSHIQELRKKGKSLSTDQYNCTFHVTALSIVLFLLVIINILMVYTQRSLLYYTEGFMVAHESIFGLYYLVIISFHSRGIRKDTYTSKVRTGYTFNEMYLVVK